MSNTDISRSQLFKIGDVAHLFGVSVQTLRHYDDIGLLKPELVDECTGYRYYSVAQFESLNTIRYLRECGMPLGNISEFFKRKTPETMISVIAEQERVLDEQIASLTSMREKLHRRKTRIEDALGSKLGTVTLEEFGPRRFAVLKTSVAPKGHLDLELSLRKLHGRGGKPLAFLGKVGVGISLEHIEAHMLDNYDLVFIELDDVESYSGKALEVEPCACLVIRFAGGHANAPAHLEQLLATARDRGLEPCGFSKEMILIDEGLSADPSRTIAEIQLPVCRA